MFIFTRRAMQGMLDDIEPWMPAAALHELVGRLNTPRTNRLPQMWELAWLYGLGRDRKVEHERPLPNGKPDLWFTVPDGDLQLVVVADVTTLSDRVLDEENPFAKLTHALREQARKAGLPGGGFHITVSHREVGDDGARSVKLQIPRGPAFEQLVKRRLKPFVRTVAAAPSEACRLEVEEPGAGFVVEYNGPSRYSGGTHRAYDAALSFDNNILANRLRDKTRQLRGAPVGAIRMLIVCDGDCSLLSRERVSEGFSAGQIAERFLRGSQTIDLVLLVSVAETREPISHRCDRRFVHWDLVVASSRRPEHLTPAKLDAVKRALREAIAHFPEPHMMPNNAFLRNFDSEWSGSMEGGYEQGGSCLRVSARAVLELLAGNMTYERFAEVHGWVGAQRNVFHHHLQSGQLFRTAAIKPLGVGEDDDWLEFEFGPPDPAVSLFRVPSTPNQTPSQSGC